MSRKKEAALLAQNEPQPSETIPSIDAEKQDVNALRELRLAKEVPAQAMVDIVRQMYPRYDKHLQSKAERSRLYGIRICDDAMDALYKAFAPEKAKRRKPEKRTHPCRLVCRVSAEDFILIKALMQQEGISTIQDWLYSLIKKYLNAKGVPQ